MINASSVNNNLSSLREENKVIEKTEDTNENHIKNKHLLGNKHLKLNTKIAKENCRNDLDENFNASKTDYRSNNKNFQHFFENKIPSNAIIFSNKNKSSNKDLLLLTKLNNENNNKIDLKNNTFANNQSFNKEKDEKAETYLYKNDISNSITNEDFIKTFEIIKNYLKIEQKQYLQNHNRLILNSKEKDLEISRLKEENKILRDQNLDLKSMIHKIFFTVKSYEADASFRVQESDIIANQLISENEYLRYICENIIKTDIEQKCDQEEIIGKTHKAESSTNQRSITESNLNHNEEIDLKSKKLHKRQITHINMQTCGNSSSINTSLEAINSNEAGISSLRGNVENNNVTIATDSNIVTDNNEKSNGDLFGLTLNEFKAEKKKKRIRIKIDDDKDKFNGNTNTNAFGTSNNPGSTKNSGKQVYLFYRTPSNKENKKIDFSSAAFKHN